MMNWMVEHWFIEAIIIIAVSFLIGIIVGKAVACVNGDN
jgi:hypothetical protein